MASRLAAIAPALARQQRLLATSAPAFSQGPSSPAAPRLPVKQAKPAPKDLGFGSANAGRTRDFSKIDLPMPATQNISLNAPRREKRDQLSARRKTSNGPKTPSGPRPPRQSTGKAAAPPTPAPKSTEAVDFYENATAGESRVQSTRKRASFASISNDVGMDLPTTASESQAPSQSRGPRGPRAGSRGPNANARFGPRTGGRAGPGPRAGGQKAGGRPQRRVRFGDRNEGGFDQDAMRRVREIWAGAQLPQPTYDRTPAGLFGTASVLNAPVLGGKLTGESWDKGLSSEEAAKQQALRLAGSYSTVLPTVPRPHDPKLAGKPFEQAKAGWSWHLALNRSANLVDSAERIRAGGEIVSKYT